MMNRNVLLFGVFGLAALVVLFVLMQPKKPVSSEQTGTQAATVYQLNIRNGKLESGFAVIQLTQGSSVTLNIQSDKDDELHLHGYDLSLSLKAQQPSSLQFIANLTGRFELELHKAHAEIAAIEVMPN